MLVTEVPRTKSFVSCLVVSSTVQRAVLVVALCLRLTFVIKTMLPRSLRVSASPSTAVQLPAVPWADEMEEAAELPALLPLSRRTSLPASPDGHSIQATSLRAPCSERHPGNSATCIVPHGLPATCGSQKTLYSIRDVRCKPERFTMRAGSLRAPGGTVGSQLHRRGWYW